MTQDNEAFDLGYAAYQKGVAQENNPYKMTQFEYSDWEDGFLTAMNDDFRSETGE